MIKNLPLDFNNIDKITNDYIAINSDSRINDIKMPLQFVKKSFNIELLDINMLNEIDSQCYYLNEYLSTIYENAYINISYLLYKNSIIELYDRYNEWIYEYISIYENINYIY
jgi:hypothetical protein